MKVILTAKVSNLGNIGDIVKVNSGYAKNFLIPNKKVLCYNELNNKIFQLKKDEFEIENYKNSEDAKKIKDKVAGKNVVIIENASDDGRLYGSVTTGIISNKINEVAGQKLITRSNIVLKKPIKDIGVYDVKINLYSGISLDIKVIVTRSESEIESLLGMKKSEIAL